MFLIETRLALRRQIEKEIYDSPIWNEWKCKNKKHQDVIDIARSIETVFTYNKYKGLKWPKKKIN